MKTKEPRKPRPGGIHVPGQTGSRPRPASQLAKDKDGNAMQKVKLPPPLLKEIDAYCKAHGQSRRVLLGLLVEEAFRERQREAGERMAARGNRPGR